METVRIEKLLNNGYGMARNQDGTIVFVEDALPGEKVELVEIKRRKGVLWARGKRQNDAPERSAPACTHAEDCGGCSLLHIKRMLELSMKLTYLKDVLSRVGRLEDPQVSGTNFSMVSSRGRGKLHVDDHGTVGFKQARGNDVVAVPQCLVIPDALRQALAGIEALAGHLRFRGDIYFAANAEGDQVVLEFRGTYGEKPKAEELAIDGIAGVILSDVRGREMISQGRPVVSFNWNGLSAHLPPAHFFQSNPASWSWFFERVDQYLELANPPRVWDVHAGSGFLSSRMKGREVFASEPDAVARKQLKTGLKAAGISASLFGGTAEQALGRKFFTPAANDGVILDPPREGLTPALCDWLKEAGPKHLLYISCEMGSFARDLKRLAEVYQIEGSIHAANVNPGTLRLEQAAILTRI